MVRALCVQGKAEGVHVKKKWTGSSRPAPALVLLAMARVACSSLSILYHCQRLVCLSHLLSSCGTCDALLYAMQEQWTGESSSHQCCPLQRSWRSYEGFSLLSGELLPKYITRQERRIQAPLAQPPAAFGEVRTFVRVRPCTLTSTGEAVLSAVTPNLLSTPDYSKVISIGGVMAITTPNRPARFRFTTSYCAFTKMHPA
jgi:hypothetical protein